MRYIVLLFLSVLPLAVFAQKKPVISGKLAVTNTHHLPLRERVVEIPWQEVVRAAGNIDTASLIVLDAARKPAPFQVYSGGTDTVQSLLVWTSIAAGQTAVLHIGQGKRPTFSPRVYARFVPERYDDFAWENNQIAYRAYGKALESTRENAFGIDVWSKRTSNLIIDQWYARNDYHRDHGEGLDYYKVGFTLGAGSVAAFHADTISFPGNYTRYEILEQGPLRVVFRLHHESWKVGAAKVSMVRQISMDAGSPFFRTDATFRISGADSVQVVVGIRKNDGEDAILLDEKNRKMGYWNPEEVPNGSIGIGCFFPDSRGEQFLTQSHLLYRTTVREGERLTYHTGAVWDKAGTVSGAAQWFNFLGETSHIASDFLPLNIAPATNK